MKSLGRQISIVFRRRHSAKDRQRVLSSFSSWRELQSVLPPPEPGPPTLLLIRLDDIGDYLLFRNQLIAYRQSARWQHHRITLLGNEAWRDLFVCLDKNVVDQTLWVNKNQYLSSAEYRMTVWRRLREAHVESVIAVSRTRPLLLDDLCLLAAAPQRSFGCVNSNVHPAWNAVSDGLYESLFRLPYEFAHEADFNAAFAEWACGMRAPGRSPSIDHAALGSPSSGGESLAANAYLICFIGASTRSKRWPLKRWLQFVALYRDRGSEQIVLAGNSRSELKMARVIQLRTGARSIAGTMALPELLRWVAGAKAVITNDTMAAHMAAALGRPTVIIANGVNYMRFSEYAQTGMRHVATVYPAVFNRKRDRVGDWDCEYSEVVSADIASIRAATVMTALDGVMAP